MDILKQKIWKVYLRKFLFSREQPLKLKISFVKTMATKGLNLCCCGERTV